MVANSKVTETTPLLLKEPISYVKDRHFEKWKKQRRNTTWVFTVFSFLLGMEYSAVVLTLWYYLKALVHINHVPIYYSVIMVSMALTGTIGNVVFGRYIDKSRNIRRFMLIINMVSIIGNLLYTLHFSVGFLILGRLLCGFNDSITAAVSGELSRCYHSDELTAVISRYQTFYTLGFVMGSGSSVMFQNIDVFIGTWHLNTDNFIGIFMALAIALCNIAVYYGVTDLSKEYNIKGLRGNGSTSNIKGLIGNSSISINQQKDVEWSYKDLIYSSRTVLVDTTGNDPVALTSLLQNFDILLIMFSSTLMSYCGVTIELLIPMLTSTDFKWSLERLSLITSGSIIVYAIFMLTVASKYIIRSNRIFGLAILFMVISCVSVGLLILPNIAHIPSDAEQIMLIIILILLITPAGFTSTAMFRNIILRIVPSNSSCFCEGVRTGFSRLGGLIGYFNAGFILPYVQYVGPAVIVTTMTLIGLLLSRRNNFIVRT